MQDKIYLFLYLLGKKPWVYKLAYLYYNIAIKFVKRSLSSKKFITSVYLKGSYGKKYFIPFISDLDFFIVGDVNDKNFRKIEKTFKLIGFLFPMVSDFDFHSQEDASFLAKHSGLKFFDINNWFLIKGKEINYSYSYHPRKFQLDILHEIYFQLEWLFKNLRKRKAKEKYRTIVIKRQYDKICDLLNYYYDYKSIEVDKRQSAFDDLWFSLSNEEIIIKFNNLLFYNDRIKKILKVYRQELYDIDIDSILQESYYKNELQLIDNGFEYTGKYHYFYKDLFELFFLTGCIDSYMLYDWTQKTNEIISKKYIEGMYITRLIEGRVNQKHDKNFLLNSNLKENVLDTCQRVKYIKQKLYLDSVDQDYCVLTAIQPDKEELLRIRHSILNFEDVDANFKFIVIVFSSLTNLDIETQDKKIEIVHIKLDENVKFLKSDYLNIKKLALEWCFLSNIVLFSSDYIDISSEWLKYIKNKLDGENIDFLLPYSSVKYQNLELFSLLETERETFSYNLSYREDKFIWAAKKQTWNKVGYLVDTNLGLYNNELFYYSITANFVVIEDGQKIYTDEFKKHFQGEYLVKKMDYQLQSREKIDLVGIKNKNVLESVFFSYLRGQYCRGIFDLWVENSDEHHQGVIQFIHNYKNFPVYELREKFKEYQGMGIANFGENFTLNDSHNYMDNIVAHDGCFATMEWISQSQLKIHTGGPAGFSFYDITLKVPLLRPCAEGQYIVKIHFDSQYGIGEESGLISLAPNAYESERSSLKLLEMKPEPISILINLNSGFNYIEFRFQGLMRSDSSYEIKFDEPYLLNQVRFESYYRKIYILEKDLDRIFLGKIHRGLYKAIFKMNEAIPPTGSFQISDGVNELSKKIEINKPLWYSVVFWISDFGPDINVILEGFKSISIEFIDIVMESNSIEDTQSLD